MSQNFSLIKISVTGMTSGKISYFPESIDADWVRVSVQDSIWYAPMEITKATDVILRYGDAEARIRFQPASGYFTVSIVGPLEDVRHLYYTIAEQHIVVKRIPKTASEQWQALLLPPVSGKMHRLFQLLKWVYEYIVTEPVAAE